MYVGFRGIRNTKTWSKSRPGASYFDFEKPKTFFFFCNLEEKNYINKVVNRVRTSKGV